MPTPLQVFACQPEPLYFNNWADLGPGQGAGFHASPEEIRRAAELRDQKQLRRALRKQKGALFLAIMQRDVEACRALLRTPAVLLECHTAEGLTPIALAAAVGDIVVVSLLLDLGANVAAKDKCGATPLMQAAHRGHAQVLQLLLDSKQGGSAGRDYLLRQSSQHGETAVTAAAKGGHVACLEVLAKAGAETGATCSCEGHAGVDALMMACRHDRTEAAKWLLQRGLSPDRTDQGGRTALMHAAAAGATQAVLLLLGLQPPPDTTLRDATGHSALHHACMGGDVAIVEALAKQGKLLEQLPEVLDGDELLRLACKAGHARVVEWLLEHKVGAHRLVLDGRGSPLMTAVKAGRKEVIEVLLAAGARIDVRDDRGRTPLAWAAANGKADMVRLLVAKGASMLCLDNFERVPRQLAYFSRQGDTSEMLAQMARARYLVPDSVVSDEALAAAIRAGGYGSAEGAVAAGLAEARYRAGGRRHSEGQHSPRGHAPDGLARSPGGVPLHALSARDYHRLLASSGKNGFRSKTVDVMWLPTHTTGGPVIGRHLFPEASQWKARALRQDSPYGKPICTRLQ